MALVVKHNSTADGDPLIDGDDWNANHTLTGGGTFRIPKLVESKTFDGGSATTTFSSLNGDADGDYFLVGKILMATYNTPYLNLRLNADDGSNYYRRDFYVEDTTTFNVEAPAAETSYRLTALAHNGTTEHQIDINIQSHTSFERLITGFTWVNKRTREGRRQYHHGVWDSNSNITSITIYGSANFDSGSVLKLYKMVDLTI